MTATPWVVTNHALLPGRNNDVLVIPDSRAIGLIVDLYATNDGVDDEVDGGVELDGDGNNSWRCRHDDSSSCDI